MQGSSCRLDVRQCNMYHHMYHHSYQICAKKQKDVMHFDTSWLKLIKLSYGAYMYNIAQWDHI